MIKYGESTKDKNAGVLWTRVNDETKAQVEKLAKDNERPMSYIIRKAIELYVNQVQSAPAQS
jgi:predicted DNA-binding protein